ncbi:MAG: ABC transporter substrate-binding protein [Algicola sp.]|nr:ABC transporter substrate-binding protein [Algicola sp.]
MAQTWKITSLDWQPYSDSKAQNNGLSIQKLRTLLKKRNINLVVEFYPWLRAQELARQNPDYVGYFPAWPEEVKAGFIGSKPIDWSSIGVIGYKGVQINWQNPEALFSAHKVCIVSTYVFPADIEQAMKNHPANTVKSPDEATIVKMLSKKRCDVALTDPKVMHFNAKLQNLDNIQTLVPSIRTKALVVAFKDNEVNRARLKLLNEIVGESVKNSDN